MNNSAIISAARRVAVEEAKAIAQLADTFGDEFVAAAELMLNARGRVIVSGMGKSGHIARKIAATLASTGTPAQFVHPAEASHGDLGMITNDDVLLVLSNSGETAELASLIEYSRRFSIPMIGMASRPNSTLLRQSDVALLLPPAPEVCPMGMAPTTSTTMSLVLGDALAVALMEHRQFSKESYKNFHPGGSLGAQLAKVRDLMSAGDDLPLVGRDTPMTEVLLVMSEKGFGVAGVTENNRLLGIITDGDLRRHMDGLLDHKAKDVMTKDPKTIPPDALAQEAVARMARKITSLFVIEQGKVVGLIRLHDCLRAGVV